MNNRNITLLIIFGFISLVSVLIAWTNRGIKGDVEIRQIENSLNQFNATPTEDQNVVDVLKSNPEFSKFVELLESHNMISAVNDLGPFTVLVPINDAIDKVDPSVWAELESDPEDLVSVIGYHLLPKLMTTSDISVLPVLSTISNRPITVNNNLNGTVSLNDAEIIITDQMASNGVVHAIDTVLIPPENNEENVGAAPEF